MAKILAHIQSYERNELVGRMTHPCNRNLALVIPIMAAACRLTRNQTCWQKGATMFSLCCGKQTRCIKRLGLGGGWFVGGGGGSRVNSGMLTRDF